MRKILYNCKLTMTIQSILELEKRDDSNLFDIHFYLECIFWKSYEWSAYLSHIFPSNLQDNKKLKIVKKQTKYDKNVYIQVGLQLSSFNKYFPGVIDDKENFILDGSHIVIRAKKYFDEYDFSKYESILNDYKNKIQFKDCLIKSNSKVSNDADIDLLLNEIISYPIESKSLVDNTSFLISIKNNAIKIKNSIQFN